MKTKILALALAALPFTASADWYIRFTTGPNTNTPTKAASVTARALGDHVKNIETNGAFLRRGVEESVSFITDFSRVCYAPAPVTNYAPVEAKPAAPNVCVWDKANATVKGKIRAMGLAPE